MYDNGLIVGMPYTAYKIFIMFIMITTDVYYVYYVYYNVYYEQQIMGCWYAPWILKTGI